MRPKLVAHLLDLRGQREAGGGEKAGEFCSWVWIFQRLLEAHSLTGRAAAGQDKLRHRRASANTAEISVRVLILVLN